jgi:transposase-like protein
MPQDPNGEKRPADVSRNSSTHRRPVTPSIKAQILALYSNGNGMLRIAALLGIDTAIVQRVVNHEEPEQVI